MKKVILGQQDYPENLKRIDGAPKELYVEGKILNQDKQAVAIVGSRKMSQYGRKIAWRFAFTLAQNKVTIVSGLAYGIDTVAHRAALAARGRTIAVLGSGLDRIYPPGNKKLAEAIARQGALVTEFSLGTAPLGQNFLVRNRIISGLSLAVVVVEGERASGTISTASHAANQGIEVFAIPGPVSSPLSEAPLYLIKQGAAVAKSPKDILEYLEAQK